MKLIFRLIAIGILFAAMASYTQAEDGHDHGASEEEEVQEEGVALSAEQRDLANIKIGPLSPRLMEYQVYAPGEVLANGYTSYLVSPRVDSVVLSRHAALGDHVEKGQALVTLFSETVAEAQAAFQVAESEWQRVKKLGSKAVGAKRYIAAQTEYEVGRGRLLAFGLSHQAIQSLAEKSQPLGEYILVAAREGAVLSDDFRQGQRLEAGQALMEIVDEEELWVEARLAPSAKLLVPVGTQALVKIGDEAFAARVTQEAHTIDELTRTRVVRLLVKNDAHRLHPGMYAEVFFTFVSDEAVLAVPESALMRGSDGDWVVFVQEEPGHYLPHEVELGRILGKWREISGIPAGSPVVMEGAFFVASEMAKGGFDPHNH